MHVRHRVAASQRHVMSSVMIALGQQPRKSLPADHRDSSNVKLVAMIRGEGFAGLLTEGDHHARHHMALARGDAMAHMH